MWKPDGISMAWRGAFTVIRLKEYLYAVNLSRKITTAPVFESIHYSGKHIKTSHHSCFSKFRISWFLCVILHGHAYVCLYAIQVTPYNKLDTLSLILTTCPNPDCYYLFAIIIHSSLFSRLPLASVTGCTYIQTIVAVTAALGPDCIVMVTEYYFSLFFSMFSLCYTFHCCFFMLFFSLVSTFKYSWCSYTNCLFIYFSISFLHFVCNGATEVETIEDKEINFSRQNEEIYVAEEE